MAYFIYYRSLNQYYFLFPYSKDRRRGSVQHPRWGENRPIQAVWLMLCVCDGGYITVATNVFRQRLLVFVFLLTLLVTEITMQTSWKPRADGGKFALRFYLPRGLIEYVPYNWDNHKWKRKCICWLNGWILRYVRILDYSSFNSDTSVLPTTEWAYINTTFHRDPLLSALSVCIYYFLSVCAFRSKKPRPSTLQMQYKTLWHSTIPTHT